MKPIILSLALLYCTYFSIGQSLLQDAAFVIPIDLTQSVSQQLVKGIIPSNAIDTHQATAWVSDGYLSAFLASDLFAVVGIVLAIIAGIFWLMYFSDVFRLASNEHSTIS